MLLRMRWFVASFSLAAMMLGTAMCWSQATAGADDHPDSRIDIYGGYGYFHPVNSGIDGKQFQDVYNPNVTASVTYYFNHFVGVQMEGGYFSGNNEHLPYFYGGSCFASCDQLVYTAEAGPVLRYPLGSWIPFIHALGGGERTNGPAQQPLKWGWGVTGGFGVDYVLPFYKHIAIRPIQADFQYSQVVYGPLELPAGVQGGFSEIDALKLSAGLVIRFGEKIEKRPVVMECNTDPAAVYPGDPVNVTGSTADLDAHKRTTFTWATTGGKITPSGPTATIDTTGLAPGDYKVSGHVQQGMRASEQAGCDAPFTVKPFEPPTISCAVSPVTANTGAPISVSATASSPQNRPLTYSYATTAGQISGTGPTATLSTAGLSAQTVTVTCNVVDDRNQSATSNATVTINVPPLPVVTQTQQLCSLSFNRDRRRPVRVDNESKACLDDIALTMGQNTGAKLEIVGNASPDENPVAAAQRALNVRQYLTREKGIDPSRIEVRVGDTSGRTVNNTLVPPGAIFNDTNTALFDENAIPRGGEAYGVPRVRGEYHGRAHHPTYHHATHDKAEHRHHHRSRTTTTPAAGAYTPQAQNDTAYPPPGGSTISQLPK